VGGSGVIKREGGYLPERSANRLGGRNLVLGGRRAEGVRRGGKVYWGAACLKYDT